MPSKTVTFTICSSLHTPAEVLWGAATTMPGVNDELWPWIRMSVPAELEGFTIDQAPVGTPAFSSWLLLLGWLPIDRHHLQLDEVHPGEGFVERSTSWLQRRWQHTRTIEPMRRIPDSQDERSKGDGSKGDGSHVHGGYVHGGYVHGGYVHGSEAPGNEESEGCTVTDRIEIEPRIGLAAAPTLFVARMVFESRHRRLRRRYGELPAT